MPPVNDQRIRAVWTTVSFDVDQAVHDKPLDGWRAPVPGTYRVESDGAGLNATLLVPAERVDQPKQLES